MYQPMFPSHDRWVVIEAFEATTDISYNTGSETLLVSIDYADRGAGLLDTPWYIVPVNIGWYIYN